jgi:RNA polymerase sigma factor (sigma-70 family)
MDYNEDKRQFGLNWLEQKINGNQMNSTTQTTTTMLFSEQEKVFREKTGKDFSLLYKKYYPKLVYYTSKMCSDPQKVEDVSTDSFLIAFEKIDKYDREKAQFSTWLFTIAKNLMLQEIKNAKKTMSMDVDLDEEGTTMKDFIEESHSELPFHELTNKKSEIMLKHIEMLKDPYRRVIEMREIQKMSYRDIADKLCKNQSTIKSKITNGRGILMRGTEQEFDLLDEMFL